MKKITAFIMAALMLFTLVGCGSTTESTPEPTPEATEAADESKMPIESCVELIKPVLENGFGEKYELDLNTEKHTLNIKIWGDDITPSAMKARDGDQDMLASWNDMVDGILTLSQSIQTLIDENCDEDYSSMLLLMNEINKENVLLVTSGSTVLYDAVNGIDLTSGS